MFNLFILILVVLFALLCWRNLRWGLYLTIICLPAYGVRFTVAWVPVTLLEIMILILFIIYFLKLLLRQADLPRSKFAGSAVLVLLIATISLFLAPDLTRAAGIWKAYFLEAFLFFVVYSPGGNCALQTCEEIKIMDRIK